MGEAEEAELAVLKADAKMRVEASLKMMALTAESVAFVRELQCLSRDALERSRDRLGTNIQNEKR